MVSISRAQARRIAVSAQLLALPRPTDLLSVVAQLERLQVDLTAHVAPSAELVVWSRIGTAGEAGLQLEEAIGNGSLVELAGFLRPVGDISLFRAEMAAWRDGVPLEPWQTGAQGWIAANDGARRDVLALLRAEGPLPARLVPDTCRVPWRSTGWTNGKNVMKLLEIMELRGEVAVASREGRERSWDLSARVWADDSESAPGLDQAQGERARRALAAAGLRRAPREVNPPPGAVPVEIDNVRGAWWVDPVGFERRDDRPASRCALLSPLDGLVTDRARLAEVFGFDYLLEMYKPAGARRWGYWAMPVLIGDGFVGKLDARSDPRRGELVVEGLHLDVEVPPADLELIHAEIGDLARHLELEVRFAD